MAYNPAVAFEELVAEWRRAAAPSQTGVVSVTDTEAVFTVTNIHSQTVVRFRADLDNDGERDFLVVVLQAWTDAKPDHRLPGVVMSDPTLSHFLDTANVYMSAVSERMKEL